MVKITKDLNNPALNGSFDIHLGISKTMAMTIKIGLPLSLTDFAMKEKRERDLQGVEQREDCHRKPFRLME